MTPAGLVASSFASSFAASVAAPQKQHNTLWHLDGPPTHAGHMYFTFIVLCSSESGVSPQHCTVLGQSGTMLGTRESVELRKWCLQLMRRLHSEEPENTDYTDAMACVLGGLGFDYSRPTVFQNLKLARELILESRQTALTLSSQPECNPLHRKLLAINCGSACSPSRVRGTGRMFRD